MTYYTIWTIKNGEENATLLENEGIIRLKLVAFIKAKKLANNLVRNFHDKVLVRKITVGSDTCEEWAFEPTY